MEKQIDVTEKYVVFELVNLLGSDKMGLQEVDFYLKSNCFDTEQEAIQALIEQEKFWMDYYILKQIRITQ